ncbi:MAG: PorT family protein [Lentimicrobium sp.]|nr:PorT family protein [Lentimicrobium sp.]
MKKIILLAAILMIANVAFSQIAGFTIGPKIGANFSKFTTDQSEIEEQIKNSFYFGAFARFGQKFYLQPELLVMKRNGTLKNNEIPGSTGTIEVGSIDVPLLVGLRILNLKVANVRVMAGPVASFAVNKSVTLDETWNDDVNFTEDDIKNANWGLQFGAGVDVLFLTLDLRYEIGLSNFSEIQDFDLKNNMFTIGLGWKIL